MDSIHINVAGARQVALRFDEFPDALYDDLKSEINALSRELYDRVREATPELTGELVAAERLRLFTDPNRITGYVDIEAGKGSQAFAKAAALEYGAHRPTKVKAYSRGAALVAAYTRTPDILEYAFERGPLAEMAPEIAARLNAIVEKAVAAANG